MEMKIQLKLKVRILILPKCLTPHPHCIFWPQNSHFSITWFKRVIFDPFLTPRGEGLNLTKHFLAEIERSHQYASNEVQTTFYEAF